MLSLWHTCSLAGIQRLAWEGGDCQGRGFLRNEGLSHNTGRTEVRAEGEGGLERTVEEQDNEYQPVPVLRPAAASRCIASPTNLSLWSCLQEERLTGTMEELLAKHMWLCVLERHKAVHQSSHAGVPLGSALQRNCHEGCSWLTIFSCCILLPGIVFMLRPVPPLPTPGDPLPPAPHLPTPS